MLINGYVTYRQYHSITNFINARSSFYLSSFMVTYDQPVWSEWTNTGLINNNGKKNYIMPPTLYKAIFKKNDIWVVEQVSVMLIMFVVGVAAVSHDGG